MENPTDEVVVKESAPLSKSISIHIENKSDKVKSVNLFSSEQNDDDIVISVFNNSEKVDHSKFVKDLNESKSSMVTCGIKIYGNGFEDFFERATISKNRDGMMASCEFIPLLYMNQNHIQDDVAFVYPYNVWIESGFDATLSVLPKTKIHCDFIIGAEVKDRNDINAKKEWMALHGSEPIYGNCIPILIENPSDESIDVKLFDINYFESNPPVRISTTGGTSYGGIIEMLKDENGVSVFRETVSQFNSLKIWSDNQNQFGRRCQREGQLMLRELLEGGGVSDTLINPYEYITPHQMQSNLLDIEGVVKYGWDKDCFIEVSVLPKTRVLYLFYELISDRERDIIEFELANKNVLERLKLKVVREEKI